MPTFTPQEQSLIIESAQKAAQRRMGDYQNRLNKLETGQYFDQSQNPSAGPGNPAVNQDYSQIQPVLEADMNAPIPQASVAPPMGGNADMVKNHLMSKGMTEQQALQFIQQNGLK